YLDRSEVFREPIAAALAKPGDGVIVDDPRGVAVALGRESGPLSRRPVAPQPDISRGWSIAEDLQIDTLNDAPDWDRANDGVESGRRIRARAEAADRLLVAKSKSPKAL